MVETGLLPQGFINSCALNVYHDGSEGIQSHFDDADRFSRPIYSLRLFSDSRLSFGTQLYGYTNGAFCVDMPRCHLEPKVSSPPLCPPLCRPPPPPFLIATSTHCPLHADMPRCYVQSAIYPPPLPFFLRLYPPLAGAVLPSIKPSFLGCPALWPPSMCPRPHSLWTYRPICTASPFPVDTWHPLALPWQILVAV